MLKISVYLVTHFFKIQLFKIFFFRNNFSHIEFSNIVLEGFVSHPKLLFSLDIKNSQKKLAALFGSHVMRVTFSFRV